MSKDTAAIRDQLGSNPEVFPTLISGFDDTFGIEEGPTKLTTDAIGTSFVLTHPDNAILGTTGLGSNGRSEAIVRVVNPNKIFHEHFRDVAYKSTPITADWDISNYRLTMTSATDRAVLYNSVATFDNIAFNDGTVSKVTVSCAETKFGGDVIRYFLRTSVSNSWEEATLNNQLDFTNTGTALQLRIVFVGNGANTTYLEDLDVSYG